MCFQHSAAMCYRHTTQWTNFAKILVLFALCIVLEQIGANEIVLEPHQTDQLEDPDQHILQKRTWKNLQGSWGKRNTDRPSIQQSSETESDYIGYSNHDDSSTDYNTDSDLDRISKYLIKSLIQQRLSQLDTQYDGTEDEYPVDKRAWNKMNGGWGKRVNAGPAQWNKFRGTCCMT